MPKYTHDNIGEAIRTKFVTGVVATIDTANDMAAVDVSGHGYTPALPLFYHCDPNVALRNVGSLVGAAAAFSGHSPLGIRWWLWRKLGALVDMSLSVSWVLLMGICGSVGAVILSGML